VYKKKLREEEFKLRLRDMLNLFRIEYGFLDETIKFSIFYDLLLVTSDHEPIFRIFRGFQPSFESIADEGVNLNPRHFEKSFVVTDHASLQKVFSGVVSGLEREEYRNVNLEDSDWKVHSVVNVVVAASGISFGKKLDESTNRGTTFF